MQQKTVHVVRTGVANLASVVAGLRRAGAEALVIDDPQQVSSAGALVLPGVGAFASAMEQLLARGLVGPLVERIRAGRPTLAICLGMQLLGAGSAESPGAAGLGVCADLHAARFDGALRVPQLGWNSIRPAAGCQITLPGYAYFANSYCFRTAPSGWGVAWADHGGPFVATLERGGVLACQFHPELSGPWGVALLQRWLRAAGARVAAC